MKEEGTGLRWKFTSKLEDLDFAYDVALISSKKKKRHVQLKTSCLPRSSVSSVFLKISTLRCPIQK